MTNTPKDVEAVARALYETQVEPARFNLTTVDFNTWEEASGSIKGFCRVQARAAIKAHLECLMEPSEEMAHAGFRAKRLHWEHRRAYEEWKDLMKEKT